jgi:hypothetical protein
MFCNQYREAIQELADNALGPVRRAELQTHLDTCEECRALAADLQKIKSAASTLDPMVPPSRVWQSIAERLRQEGRAAKAPASRVRAAVLAIAASLVLAVGASLYMLRTYDRAVPGSSGSSNVTAAQDGNATTADAVQSINDDLAAVVKHYESAIVKLEQVVNSEDSPIDPQTAEILKKNLPVIDQVIAESQSALQSEPQSAPARESLFEALRKKVNLLQSTIVLMNEMRKGNSAGAAQLVDPENKS